MSGREGSNRRRRSGRTERSHQGQEHQDRAGGRNRPAGGSRGSPGRGPRFAPGEKTQHCQQNPGPNNAPRYGKNGGMHDRLRWTAPRLNTDPLPVPECIRCGKPIEDIHTALTDKKTGSAVHFDCVIAELTEHETLEEGDVLSYIGGGRFGIVHFNKSGGKGGRLQKPGGNFTIKKIFEWEDKGDRAEWRGVVADHYSIT